ncbi:MAG: hypothetical protein ABSH41_13580, partial [Syntrophobacteraceae bacterium]
MKRRLNDRQPAQPLSVYRGAPVDPYRSLALVGGLFVAVIHVSLGLFRILRRQKTRLRVQDCLFEIGGARDSNLNRVAPTLRSVFPFGDYHAAPISLACTTIRRQLIASIMSAGKRVIRCYRIDGGAALAAHDVNQSLNPSIPQFYDVPF